MNGFMLSIIAGSCLSISLQLMHLIEILEQTGATP